MYKSFFFFYIEQFQTSNLHTRLSGLVLKWFKNKLMYYTGSQHTSEYFITDKMVETNLLLFLLVPLWTERKNANGATQFINAIRSAVAQRHEAKQGRVWKTINIFMALSGLLSTMAEGDGMHPGAMKSST